MKSPRALPPLARPVARYEGRQHERAHLRGAGDGRHLLHGRVGGDQVSEQRLLPRGPRVWQELVHPAGVDDLVHEDVRAAGELGEVVARARVAGEHHRAGVGVEPVRQRWEHRCVLDERGPHADSVVLVELHGPHPRVRITVGVRDVPGRDRHVDAAEQLAGRR